MAGGEVDAVVVGAGFGGLYMLHRLRGIGLTCRAFEAGSDVGGTWYWNRYPGARCDVESMEYSFSFDEDLEQEWRWTERYATQPEILRYAQHVAERYDLRRDVTFDTRVIAATWEDAADRWTVETDAGEKVSARFCIMATGCLSTVNRPDIPGLADFGGAIYQTGLWPHGGVDFAGQRVCLIGTGSSAIQSIPVIAREAERLTVFQRTANYVAPARNHPMNEAYEAEFKADYKARRIKQRNGYFGGLPSGRQLSVPSMSVSAAEREAIYEEAWGNGGLGILGSFPDLLLDRAGNESLAEFVRGKVRAIVQDPKTAELLCPRSHPVGSKRMCIDTGYFETFNRDNVSLVDLKSEPIERISGAAVVTSRREYPCDALVLATGFDAMTGTLAKIAVTGRGGQALTDAWTGGPAAYLGLMVAGFPNLFLITGPQSPSVLSNMLVSIEQHVDWIAGCIGTMQRSGARAVEADAAAQEAWLDHCAAVAAPTVYPDAASWYTGANVAGKPRVFMAYIGGVPGYRAIGEAVANGGYGGFSFDGATSAVPPDFDAVLGAAMAALAA